MHTSYAYPSHLVILLDVALVTLIGLLALYRHRLSWPMSRAERWLRELARHPTRAVLLIGLLGVIGNALVFMAFRPPVATVADEHSYLLAADTFSAGRLANPSHPMWRHFDTPHVLQWPAYASKYPPAQGLLLALGQTLGGSPAWALCLAAGLLAAALTWMFQAWLPAPWAILGGLLVLLRLGVGSYWNQSYWGGSIAAIGGALLYGALPRLMTRASPGQALILAAGLVLLAVSRPFEGLLASLPAAFVMARLIVVSKWPARFRLVLPIASALTLTTLTIGHYNQRVTGDLWQPPHLGYQIAYNYPPEWIFQARQGPSFEHQTRAPDRSAANSRFRSPPAQTWLGTALRQGFERARRMLYFVLGLAMIVPLVAWVVFRRGTSSSLVSSPRVLPFGVLLAACLLVLAGNSLTREWFPHYSAPIAGPLLVFGLQGLRRLGTHRPAALPAGRLWVAAVVGINAVLFLIQLPAYRADENHAGVQRARIMSRLSEGSQRHLVLVHGSGHGGGNWTANAADIDAAQIVWAHDHGRRANGALLDYFQDRQIWWLDSTAHGKIELDTYPPTKQESTTNEPGEVSVRAKNATLNLPSARAPTRNP